jgi:hypothetical protein
MGGKFRGRTELRPDKLLERSPAGVRRVEGKWGQSMQIKIRQPVAFDVTPAEDSFVIRFVTENEHEAVVTISRDLLPELIAKLQEIDTPAPEEEAEEAPAPAPQVAKDDETRRVLLRALTGGVTRAA